MSNDDWKEAIYYYIINLSCRLNHYKKILTEYKMKLNKTDFDLGLLWITSVYSNVQNSDRTSLCAASRPW